MAKFSSRDLDYLYSLRVCQVTLDLNPLPTLTVNGHVLL